MSDMEQVMARWAEHRKRQAQVNELNQPAIFEALAALGIGQVEVSFDGYGDSGQIEAITVTGATDQLSGEVTLVYSPWEQSDESRTRPLVEAVEELCYSLLECEHDGWEINDGAFGTFAFDVVSQKIVLEFNGRYLDYHTHVHTYSDGEA